MRRKNAAGRSAWLVPRSVAADSSSDRCWRLLGGGSQSCQFQAVAAPSRHCTRSCSTGSLRVGRCWLRAAGGSGCASLAMPFFLFHALGLSFCSLVPSFLCPLFLPPATDDDDGSSPCQMPDRGFASWVSMVYLHAGTHGCTNPHHSICISRVLVPIILDLLDMDS